MDDLKERYPFLFQWKFDGLECLPSMPDHQNAFIKKRLKSATFSVVLGEEGLLQQAKELYLENKAQQMENDFVEMCMYYAEACLNAIERVRFGEKREKVLVDLGDQILPETRGRKGRIKSNKALPFLFTHNTKKLFKTIHKELMSCIKEIWQKEDISLRQFGDGELVTSTVKSVKQGSPWVEEILTDEEIKLISLQDKAANANIPKSQFRISEIAWKIMGGRIKVSPHSLRKSLIGIPPL